MSVTLYAKCGQCGAVNRLDTLRATPTLMVFRNGRVAEQTTGALPETRLQEFVEKHVS